VREEGEVLVPMFWAEAGRAKRMQIAASRMQSVQNGRWKMENGKEEVEARWRVRRGMVGIGVVGVGVGN